MLGKSLGEVRALPAAELAEWIAYDRVEGLPDINAAQAHVCQTMFAVMGGKRVKLDDLMLRPATATVKRLTAEESAGMLGRAIGRAIGRGGEARLASNPGRASL